MSARSPISSPFVRSPPQHNFPFLGGIIARIDEWSRVWMVNWICIRILLIMAALATVLRLVIGRWENSSHLLLQSPARFARFVETRASAFAQERQSPGVRRRSTVELSPRSCDGAQLDALLVRLQLVEAENEDLRRNVDFQSARSEQMLSARSNAFDDGSSTALPTPRDSASPRGVDIETELLHYKQRVRELEAHGQQLADEGDRMRQLSELHAQRLSVLEAEEINAAAEIGRLQGALSSKTEEAKLLKIKLDQIAGADAAWSPGSSVLREENLRLVERLAKQQHEVWELEAVIQSCSSQAHELRKMIAEKDATLLALFGEQASRKITKERVRQLGSKEMALVAEVQCALEESLRQNRILQARLEAMSQNDDPTKKIQ